MLESCKEIAEFYADASSLLLTIIVGENAVNVDARNYTTKEAQGLMITALEGMDNITNVSVDVTNSVNEE